MPSEGTDGGGKDPIGPISKARAELFFRESDFHGSYSSSLPIFLESLSFKSSINTENTAASSGSSSA